MLSKVEFNDLFKPAMQLAFGKTLICRNQDICSQFSKSHDIDTITLEGKHVIFIYICTKHLLKIKNVKLKVLTYTNTNFYCSGDKFSRRGTLEGGYVNPNNSRLLYQKKIWELQAKLEKQENDLSQVREQLNALDGETTKVTSDWQKSEMTTVQLRLVRRETFIWFCIQ